MKLRKENAKEICSYVELSPSSYSRSNRQGNVTEPFRRKEVNTVQHVRNCFSTINVRCFLVELWVGSFPFAVFL